MITVLCPAATIVGDRRKRLEANDEEEKETQRNRGLFSPLLSFVMIFMVPGRARGKKWQRRSSVIAGCKKRKKLTQQEDAGRRKKGRGNKDTSTDKQEEKNQRFPSPPVCFREDGKKTVPHYHLRKTERAAAVSAGVVEKVADPPTHLPMKKRERQQNEAWPWAKWY